MKPIGSRDRYDRDADAGLRSSGGPGPDTPPLAPQTSAFPPPTSKAGPRRHRSGCGATVRLLHRRHGWNWEVLPASWRSFWPTVPVVMRSRRGLCSVVVPGHDHRAGALTAVSIFAALVDTSLLRRKPPRSGRGPLLLPHTTTRAAGGPTTTRPAPGHVVPTLGRDVADPGRGRGQRARRRRREERSPSTRFRTRLLATGTAARQSLTASWRPPALASARVGRMWYR